MARRAKKNETKTGICTSGKRSVLSGWVLLVMNSWRGPPPRMPVRVRARDVRVPAHPPPPAPHLLQLELHGLGRRAVPLARVRIHAGRVLLLGAAPPPVSAA
jgi:hypothetical protein